VNIITNFFKKIKKTKHVKSIINCDEKNNKKALRITFLFALFLGTVLILISIILNDILDSDIIPSKFNIYIDIVVNLVKNFGIAIIIAYIFSFVSSTQTFMNFIRDRLISIIITKDFLGKVSNDERREMTKKILNYTEEPVYSGINDYFNKHISQSLSLFETHFRSAYQVNAIAKLDINKKVVRVDAELRYRMYKVSGNFEKLNIGFEDETVEDQPIIIYTPDGKMKTINTKLISKEDIKNTKTGFETNFQNDASLVKESFAILDKKLKQELEQYDYLDVVNRFTEFGNDHWHLFTLRITKPCDKLSIYLSCDDELVIKKYIPFGELNSFNINCRDENKIIDIFCNEWIEAGLGVAILIANKKETRKQLKIPKKKK
jgi:hypothetical protein